MLLHDASFYNSIQITRQRPIKRCCHLSAGQESIPDQIVIYEDFDGQGNGVQASNVEEKHNLKCKKI